MSEGGAPLRAGRESALDLSSVREVVARAEERARDLQVLQSLGTALSRTLDETVLIGELIRGIQNAVGVEDVLIAVVDQESGHLVTRGRGEVSPEETAECMDEIILDAPEVRNALLDGHTHAVTVGEDALLIAPMKHASRLIGAVLVRDSRSELHGSGERTDLVHAMATQASAALRNAQLYAESERERRQSEAMADVARAVGESLRTGEVMRRILRHAMALLRVEGAFISLRDGEYLKIEAAIGSASVLAGVIVPSDGSVGGAACRTGEVVISNSASDDAQMHRRLTDPVRVDRLAAAPLLSVGGAIGTIECINRNEPFTAGDARVLRRLADQVSVAVLNARLFEDVQAATREWSQTFDAIGLGMAVVNEEGCIVRCNTRARQMTDAVLPLALVGKSLYDVFLGVRPAADQDPLHSALHNGVEQHAVLDGHRAGESFRLDVRAAPHPVGAVVTFFRVDAHEA